MIPLPIPLNSIDLNIETSTRFDDLNEFLSTFDDCIALKVTLKNGETFYFERRIEDEQPLDITYLKRMGLKYHNSFGCIKKPFDTEDFIEYKSSSTNGKVRCLIWIADVFFKYGIEIPTEIRQKIMELDDEKFDVLSRNISIMKFMTQRIASD